MGLHKRIATKFWRQLETNLKLKEIYLEVVGRVTEIITLTVMSFV